MSARPRSFLKYANKKDNPLIAFEKGVARLHRCLVSFISPHRNVIILIQNNQFINTNNVSSQNLRGILQSSPGSNIRQGYGFSVNGQAKKRLLTISDQ